MSKNAAALVFRSEASTAMSLHRRVGGQPIAIVPLLARALEGYRRHLRNNPHAWIPLVCAATASGKASSFLAFGADDALELPYDWRYEILLSRMQPKIIVTNIHSDGYEQAIYDGLLDEYITKINRKVPRPRGPLPAGYRNRKEYETAYAARKTGVKPPAQFRDKVKEEVEHERAQTESPHVDLRGVRVFTKEEYAARKRKRSRDPGE